MKYRGAKLCLLVGLVALAASACGSARRAMVHEEDWSKVFPWPRAKESVTIRAKPKTTMANACFLLGSYREVEVTPDTTFFMEDDLGKPFAYTPSRSPIRRLSTIKNMEIGWPTQEEEAPPEAAATEDGESDKAQPEEAQEAGEGDEAKPSGDEGGEKAPSAKPSGEGEQSTAPSSDRADQAAPSKKGTPD